MYIVTVWLFGCGISRTYRTHDLGCTYMHRLTSASLRSHLASHRPQEHSSSLAEFRWGLRVALWEAFGPEKVLSKPLSVASLCLGQVCRP